MFDLLKPSARNNIDQRQFMTKRGKDQHTSDREFNPGDAIYVRRPIDRTWATAVVSERTAPLSYTTTVGQRVHADHMKRRSVSTPQQADESTTMPNPPPADDNNQQTQITPTLRRSSRPNLGVPPFRFQDEFCL